MSAFVLHWTERVLRPQPHSLQNEKRYNVSKSNKRVNSRETEVPYLDTRMVQGGHGPGWHNNVHRCSQMNHGVGLSLDRPQTSPHECAISMRFQSVCSLLFPQKHIYFSGTSVFSSWQAGHRQLLLSGIELFSSTLENIVLTQNNRNLPFLDDLAHLIIHHMCSTW